MLVQLLQSRVKKNPAGFGFVSERVGDVVEVDAAEGGRMIAARQAVAIDESQAAENQALRPAGRRRKRDNAQAGE